VMACNLHMYFREAGVLAGIGNIRDPFKKNQRTLVLASHDFILPPEIANDVVILNEPLPNVEQLKQVVIDTYKVVEIKQPKPEQIEREADALVGLPYFVAEQTCATSMTKDGIEMERMVERRRQEIEQVPGVTVWRGNERFSTIGGNDNIKNFLTRIGAGRNRPRALIFQDEVEKQYGGVAGDLSGTTTEMLGNVLSFMADNDSTGILNLGHAGVGKSEIAKALGNELGVPTIKLDLGQAKGSLVGESNQNLRRILNIIQAVSQGRALWIATCNGFKNLPPELKSRFSYGTFFFDLPSWTERQAIWNIHLAKWKITQDQMPCPADDSWTGREIKNCCRLAHDLQIPLVEAAGYIVPMATNHKAEIEALRAEANGNFISAAKPGIYKAPEGTSTPDDADTTIVAVAMVPNKARKIRLAAPEPKKGGKPN
jgi:hypothetical protein